jgi:hypothetical protein
LTVALEANFFSTPLDTLLHGTSTATCWSKRPILIAMGTGATVSARSIFLRILDHIGRDGGFSRAGCKQFSPRLD